MAILFVSMFTLDAFTPGLTLLQQLKGFFIHLIPSFILIIVLLIAWKWELTGGIIFVLLGIGLSPFIFLMNYHRTNSMLVGFVVTLMITLPFIIIGILFIINHHKKQIEH